MLLLLLACAGADKPGDDTAPIDTGPLPSGTVTLGAACDLTDRIGEIGLWANGSERYLEGRIFDRPDPWVGPAERATESCAFHRFSTTSCGTCEEGYVCGFEGACVPARRTVPATLDVTVDGATETFTADATTGDLYGAAGPLEAGYQLTLTVGGESAVFPELTPLGEIPDLVVTGEGDSMAPTSLAAAWTPPADGGRVRTVIPINHHAAGPTFTHCDVDAATGAFAADEEMLAPLAVVTGIEFQGVDHARSATVTLDAGCLDVRIGTRWYTSVDWSAE